MKQTAILAALLLAGASWAAPAAAQPVQMQTISGTRLDVVATGEVQRVPDLAIISAGVVTQATTASQAISDNARRMMTVRAALRGAGIPDRDIQTSTINLNPQYRYAENQPPRLTGYQASNEVRIRFRDIANAGKILDALVAQGANQINGPMLTIDKPEEALDEARAAALATAQRRAEAYARQLGKRVTRILAVSETSEPVRPYPMMMVREAAAQGAVADSKIDPGEQAVSAALTVTFELE